MSNLSNIISNAEQYSANYQAVGASTTATLSGGGGGDKGDFIAGILVVPTSLSPATITIADGGGGAITIFAGGASSLSNLVSFYIPLGIKSVTGPWTITTGANASVLVTGGFT